MNKKIIISLISVVAGLALVFVFVIPEWSAIKVSRTEISQKKMEITKLEELLAKVQQLDEEYEDAKDEVDKAFLSLPQEKDVPHLLVQFESLASSNGLLLESINFGEITEETETGSSQSGSSQAKKLIAGFPSMSVDIKVIGSYDAFKNYLAALENNIRSMAVESIQLSLGQEETGLLSIFEIDLAVSVYYQ